MAMLNDYVHQLHKRVRSTGANYALLTCAAIASAPVIYSLAYLVCRQHKTVVVDIVSMLYSPRVNVVDLNAAEGAEKENEGNGKASDDRRVAHCPHITLHMSWPQYAVRFRQLQRCTVRQYTSRCARGREEHDSGAFLFSFAGMVSRTQMLPPKAFAAKCAHSVATTYGKYMMHQLLRDFVLDVCVEVLVMAICITTEQAYMRGDGCTLPGSLSGLGSSLLAVAQSGLLSGLRALRHNALLTGICNKIGVASNTPVASSDASSVLQDEMQCLPISSLYGLYEAGIVVAHTTLLAATALGNITHSPTIVKLSYLLVLIRAPGDLPDMLHMFHSTSQGVSCTQPEVIAHYIALFAIGRLLQSCKSSLRTLVREYGGCNKPKRH